MIRGCCPDCGGARPLADYLAEPSARAALAAALACPAPLAQRIVPYLELHAPPPAAPGAAPAPRRRLASAKLARLLTELAALLATGQVTRHGASLPCPPATWELALDEVLAARDGGRLQLPLRGHGYLIAVAWAQAEAAATQATAHARGQAPLHPSHRPASPAGRGAPAQADRAAGLAQVGALVQALRGGQAEE